MGAEGTAPTPGTGTVAGALVASSVSAGRGAAAAGVGDGLGSGAAPSTTCRTCTLARVAAPLAAPADPSRTVTAHSNNACKTSTANTTGAIARMRLV